MLTDKRGIAENRFWFNFFDKVVSLFRAVPFIILLAFIAPVTQSIVGTQIGPTAALVPLSLGVFPFYARQVQAAIAGVDRGKIEAAQSVGATTTDLIFDVYLREASSELIRVTTVTLISLIGLTAMLVPLVVVALGTPQLLTDTINFRTTSRLWPRS